MEGNDARLSPFMLEYRLTNVERDLDDMKLTIAKLATKDDMHAIADQITAGNEWKKSFAAPLAVGALIAVLNISALFWLHAHP